MKTCQQSLAFICSGQSILFSVFMNNFDDRLMYPCKTYRQNQGFNKIHVWRACWGSAFKILDSSFKV